LKDAFSSPNLKVCFVGKKQIDYMGESNHVKPKVSVYDLSEFIMTFKHQNLLKIWLNYIKETQFL